MKCGEDKNYKIAFLISHPIQYFSPLFKQMSKNNKIDLTVYYCFDETIRYFKDIEFGKKIKWDIPLLEGYKYKFLRNYSPKPSIFKGFFGLINVGIVRELFKSNYDLLIIHGWNYFTHILAIFMAKLKRIKVFMRGENPYKQEIKKSKLKIVLKKILLKNFIFKLIDGFLYVGEQNKKLYKFYGGSEKKLFLFPYAVDNERFAREYEKLKKQKNLKEKLNLPCDKIIILFVGKLVDKKRPFDLLKAYEIIKNEKKALLFVGDGYLRKELEDYVKDKNINDVYFAGFKNQTELPLYYTCADIFVLPSDIGETWGLVVNEAMNFELPIIVSDMVGCAEDLVKNGENGFIYKVSDIEKLAEYLEVLIKDKDLKEKMSRKSKEIIKKYSYGESIRLFLKNVEIVVKKNTL